MLENTLLVASQVVTLFLLMSVGFLLTKLGLLTENGRGQITNLLLFVVGPCIVVDTLQIESNDMLVQTMFVGLLIQLFLYAIAVAVTFAFFRKEPADLRLPLRYGVVYGNVGFMGLPLVQAILGEGGLVFAVIAQVAFNLSTWSHGVLLMGGREEFSPARMVINPGILSSIFAMGLFLPGILLPAPVGNAVEFLGSMNTPLAMIIIGSQMAGANLLDTFRNTKLYLSAGLRLLVIPLLVFVFLLPLACDVTMKLTFVILAATPTAGFTAIFAQRFGRDTEAAAELITLTTLLSIVTLPVFAATAMSLYG